MIDISSARVSKLIVHRVGNKLRDEGYSLSQKEAPRTESLDDLILRCYLAPVIRNGDVTEFYHESDLSLNVVHHFSDAIFEDSKSFKSNAQNIAKHLYSASEHPNIVGGELIIVLFDGVRIVDKELQALGLFRIEGKDDFLDVASDGGSIQLVERVGISVEKIQKGAVILSGGLTVYAVDALSQKTKYWLDSFLKVLPAESSKVCAKAAGAFIKSVSQKVVSPNDALEFGKKVQETLEKSDTVSMAQIRKISSNYLALSEVNGILSGIKERVGLDIRDEVELDVRQLNRYAREVVKRARIADGINLVIANQDAHVSAVDVKRTRNGLRAVIDIQLDGE